MILFLIKILSIIFIVLCAVYLILRRIVTHHKPKGFPSKGIRTEQNKKVIVCAGDSNTHGNVSHNWVAELQDTLPDFQIINAGLNSDLTFSLLSRLNDIIACDPDYITVLIGTNDVNAYYSKKSLKRYIDNKKITPDQIPDIHSFEQNLIHIVRELKTKTKSKIALMTLPLMGEDLTSKVNEIADQYSSIIEKIGQSEGIRVLPVRQIQKDYLIQNPSESSYQFDDYFLLLNKSVIMHYLLGFSWERISAIHKNRLSPDFLHQNEKAGRMIKNEVLKWIRNDE